MPVLRFEKPALSEVEGILRFAQNDRQEVNRPFIRAKGMGKMLALIAATKICGLVLRACFLQAICYGAENHPQAAGAAENGQREFVGAAR